MIREGEHLREIAHRRLGYVGLPVGVCRKRCSRVERKVRSDAGKMLRIEGKDALQSLNHVCREHRDKAEDKHGNAVLGPAHLVGLVDAGDSVEQFLDGPEDWIGEGALALEDLRHIAAERLCAGEHEQEEEADLKPAVGGHFV